MMRHKHNIIPNTQTDKVFFKQSYLFSINDEMMSAQQQTKHN